MLKRLPVGQNRTIIILADNGYEISQGIYYQVQIGEKTVVSTSRICGAAKDSGSLEFKILSAAGGNLIALYEETNPERVLALHDFNKGRSWPRGAPDEWTNDIDSRGEDLLKQLQQEYPHSNFRLNHGGPCGIEIPRDR